MANLVIKDKVVGVEIKLVTRAGVFSKQGIDSGSRLLMEKMQVTDGTMVADLGAGAGLVGIVAAKLNPHGHIHFLEDHLRSYETARENVELNGLKNAEVFLSDLFSAVPQRSYHLIISNPPQHLGNEFLEEAAGECLKHLKPGGQVYWVMQSHLESFTQTLFKKVFGGYKIMAHGKEHVVVSAYGK